MTGVRVVGRRDRGVDRRQQRFAVERLDDRQRAGVADPDAGVAGDEHDRRQHAPAAKPIAQLRTADAGKAHVDNQAVEGQAGDVGRFDRLGRFERPHLVPQAAEQPGDGGARPVVVIDDSQP